MYLPCPRLHAWAVKLMVLVLLDAFLYIRAFLYEDDRPLVYPYGDAAGWLLFWFHCFYLKSHLQGIAQSQRSIISVALALGIANIFRL